MKFGTITFTPGGGTYPICTLSFTRDIVAKGGPIKRFEMTLPIPSGVIPSSTAVITVEAPGPLKGTKWEAFGIEASSFRPDADHTFVVAKAVLQSGKYVELPVRHAGSCVGFLR